MWFLPRDMNTALTEDTPVFENVPDLRIWRKISQLGISFAGVDSLPYPVFLLWQSIYYTDNWLNTHNHESFSNASVNTHVYQY